MRNKAPIRSEDQILNAARSVYQIACLLKLSRQEWRDMYHLDIFSKVTAPLASDEAILSAFARGVQQVYETNILLDHCEFVYFVDGVRMSVKEVISQGPDARLSAVCGHQWKDSEFNFTEFTKEADL